MRHDHRLYFVTDQRTVKQFDLPGVLFATKIVSSKKDDFAPWVLDRTFG